MKFVLQSFKKKHFLFCNRESRYNCLKKNQLDVQIIICVFRLFDVCTTMHH